MRWQVTHPKYRRCVSAGACKPSANDEDGASDVPAVKVNWNDATAYAVWVSKQCGFDWRLPTGEEWAFFAGSRFHDD
jgi:formylglycine-generating enzyme required for sulfatase activity